MIIIASFGANYDSKNYRSCYFELSPYSGQYQLLKNSGVNWQGHLCNELRFYL